MENRRNSSQDTYMFLGFVVLAATVVLVVLIATSSWNTEGWTALGAVAAGFQALGVLAAVWYASGQLAETRSLRRRQNRPFVVLDFDIMTHPYVILIEVVNLGSVLARNVRFSFTPELQSSVADYQQDPSDFAKQTFSTIVPGARISTVFDIQSEREGRLDDPDFPQFHEVTVTCEDELGKCFRDKYTLDLRPYRLRSFVPQKTIHDAATSLKSIDKKLAKLLPTETGPGERPGLDRLRRRLLEDE